MRAVLKTSRGAGVAGGRAGAGRGEEPAARVQGIRRCRGQGGRLSASQRGRGGAGGVGDPESQRRRGGVGRKGAGGAGRVTAAEWRSRAQGGRLRVAPALERRRGGVGCRGAGGTGRATAAEWRRRAQGGRRRPWGGDGRDRRGGVRSQGTKVY
ncbi:hypothetical protein E2562_027477 [Oryza meyeriana var. granulata]|uniref:Uncharacterized protein n=1 Tax=Oryza meyeriana var. granulata TaxID=110450 RepID=A0A6G1E2Y9_9ORYZ|nr:hypothetical protein E2562_027477 [Oryza meyeriana var. granulata]